MKDELFEIPDEILSRYKLLDKVLDPQKNSISPVIIKERYKGYTSKSNIFSDSSDSLFLYIPIWRLIYMSLLTLGLYDLYWMYKNWSYSEKNKFMPFRALLKGICGIIFIYRLLKYIKQNEVINIIKKAQFSPLLLASGWILFVILGYTTILYGASSYYLFGILISLPRLFFLIPIQKYINKVNESVFPKPAYYRWSIGQTACLVFGSLQWLFLL